MTASTRFHDAARDGYLDLLRDATRRDCNTPDDDGITPVMWAAACGNLDALRMLVGRGGDPNKSDFYGNTALHCAAANNQMNCVSYLVNYGVNLFALENEYHTAKELAGIKGHTEILCYLDTVISKQCALNSKTVQKQKEKAVMDVEKRVREMEKLQKKATKKAEKDEKKLGKERLKLSSIFARNNMDYTTSSQSSIGGGSASQCIKNFGKLSYESPRFSEIVNNDSGRETARSVSSSITVKTTRKGLTGVSKKILKNKKSNNNKNATDADFKVRETERDGRLSVRSLSGLRRDSEILYVPKYIDTQSINSSSNGQQRKRLQDIFDTTGARIHRVASEPFLPGIGVHDEEVQQHPGLLKRQAFGNVFRQTSMSGTLLSIPKNFQGNHRDEARFRATQSSSPWKCSHTASDSDSIGSAGSLAHRNSKGVGLTRDGGIDRSTHDWINEEGPNRIDNYVEDSDDYPNKHGALATFLAAYDLRLCLQQFIEEQIDLKALLLLNEDDLKELGLSLGTRKKLMDAIICRKETLRCAGHIYDSKL